MRRLTPRQPSQHGVSLPADWGRRGVSLPVVPGGLDEEWSTRSLPQNIKFNGSFAGKYFGPKFFDMSYCTQNEAESVSFLSLAHNKNSLYADSRRGFGFLDLQSIIYLNHF